MNSNLYIEYLSPIGLLAISAKEDGISEIKLISESQSICSNKNIHIENCIRFLDDYFNHKDHKQPEISKYIDGTEFEKRVWAETMKVPYGSTSVYSDISEKMNLKNGSRAVGNALHKNPILILIPCHRVIGKSGKLVGFAAGINKKKELLKIESPQSTMF